MLLVSGWFAGVFVSPGK